MNAVTASRAGMVTGAVALFSVLPPIGIDTWIVPALLALVAAGLGIVAFRGGQQRLGGLALFAASIGGVGGVLAANAQRSTLDDLVTAGLFAATLRYATPLVLGGLGGMICERSGVTNIAIEGMMLMGCFWGFWAASVSLSWPVGVAAAIVAGGVSALVHAFFSIHLGADQVISGTAINILAAGVTSFAFRSLIGSQNAPDVDQIPNVTIPGLKDVPFVGGVIGDQNLLVWVMFALVAIITIYFNRTPWGLRHRAVGEHPRAADSVGIDVFRVRYAAVIVSGMLAGLGGAFFSFGFSSTFIENMTGGSGFIALAAVVFGNWRPIGVLGAALLFGFASALGNAMQTAANIDATLMNALPYVFTLVAMVGLVGRSRPPAAAGKPYRKQ